MAKGFPLRVTRRADISTGKAWLVRLCAILLALLTGGVFVAILGYDPSGRLPGDDLRLARLAHEHRTDGQTDHPPAHHLAGRDAGVQDALLEHRRGGADLRAAPSPPPTSPSSTTIGRSGYCFIVMALAGILAGGLYGMIPAYFKCRFGTNETLLTLMLNYVALYTIQALQQGPWRDPTQLGFFKVARFSSSARVPEVLGVHAGWIVALVLVALFYVYLRHSKQGYELTVVGENEATARYAGMPVKRVVIRTMFLSAGVCGLAGMLQASGADRTLNDTVAGGVGFTAITVAWLARLNPVGMLIVSVLFCILEKGCASVQSVYNLSAATAEVLQGIILFFVLGCEFFLTHRVCRASKLEGGVERG